MKDKAKMKKLFMAGFLVKTAVTLLFVGNMIVTKGTISIPFLNDYVYEKVISMEEKDELMADDMQYFVLGESGNTSFCVSLEDFSR